MQEQDLLLSDKGDLVIKDFDLLLTSDKQILTQAIWQELKTFKGDWFLDIDKGLPYYQDILGQRNSIDSVRAIFIEAIKSVSGVKEIVDLELNLNGKDRTLDVSITVLDEYNNNINVNL